MEADLLHGHPHVLWTTRILKINPHFAAKQRLGPLLVSTPRRGPVTSKYHRLPPLKAGRTELPSGGVSPKLQTWALRHAAKR